MKLKFQKLSALMLSFVLFLTSLVCNITSFATSQSQGDDPVNVLAGLTPIAFMAVAPGGTAYDWTAMRGPNAEWGWDGYDKSNSREDVSVTKVVRWENYVAKLTDENVDESFLLRAVDTSKEILITYQITESALSRFSMAGINCTSINFYASDSYATLFNNVISTSTPSEGSVSTEISVQKAKFVGFRLKGCNSYIKEISVYGKALETEPETEKESLISGLIPTAFMAVADGATAFDWTKMRGPNAEYGWYGYDTTASHGTYGAGGSAYRDWAPYVAKLTDGSVAEDFLLRAEDTSKDILIAYEIEASNVTGFSMAGIKCNSIDVYVSNHYATLFSSVLTTVTPSDSAASAELSANGITYIGFRLNGCNCRMKEISIYGSSANEAIDSPDVLKGLIPQMYSAVDSGKTVYNWTQVRYGVEEQEHKYGYDLHLNDSNPTRQQERADFWKPYLTNLTDSDENTQLFIRAERYWQKDNVVLIYEIPESVIEGFSIITDSTINKNVDIYISQSYAGLFDKKADVVSTSRSTIKQNQKMNIRAKYIAIVLIDPRYSVSEIMFFGNAYVRPDYGTNLVLGKTPSQLFIANREYPLSHTGGRIYSYMTDASRMEALTDDRFDTTYSWAHDGNAKKTTKDSLYKVIAYDLGSVCQLSTIIIDSQCGGYDIFVSNDYTELFDPDKYRVYTSGGDELLPDGSELDPQYDLDSGENVIDVSGVSGRYVGIVITRGSRLEKEIYEACYITEIQVFGEAGNSDYGDNLISGKLPLFIYRAKYEKYDTSLGELSVEGTGASLFTDGDKNNLTKILFPNNSGRLAYDHGVAVMIYYLEGECDVNAFSVNSRYFYAPGGLDVFVSNDFDSLFDQKNRAFATGGEIAEEKVYDTTKDLGAVSISASFENPKQGRYVAFVVTRVHESVIADGWGQLYLREIELFGKVNQKENLPSTTVYDKKTGTSVTFLYKNPDDTFLFANKGISSVRLRNVQKSQYQNDTFLNSLKRNNFTLLGNAFYLEFLNKNNKVIPNSFFQGEEIRITFTFGNNRLRRLTEIRNDVAYVIKQAEQTNNEIVLKTDQFGQLFAFVGFASKSVDAAAIESDLSFSQEGIGSANNTDSMAYSSNTAGFDDAFDFADEEEYTDENDDAGESNPGDEKAGTISKKKRWITVAVDDPFEWLWNIIDTFSANIWMLIICIGAVLLSVMGLVFEIIYLKKRRKIS